MDSEKINDWLQVIGVFGVIASLVFVGLQLKQSQDIALAAQYHARAAAVMDYRAVQLASGFDFSTRFQPEGEGGLSPAQHNALVGASEWAWTQLDNNHYQHEAGFLDDESWQALQNNIRGLSAGISRRVFEDKKPTMRRSFVEFVEQRWKEAGG